MVVKNASSSCTVYIDGASIAGSFTNQTVVASTSDIYIGAYSTPSLYFNGSLAEVAIYNTALGATAVAAHYAAKTTAEPSIIGQRGYTRTKTIQARSRLTPTAAQQIALAYLNATQTPPLKGNITVRGTIGAYGTGARIPVGCIQPGELVMLGNETHPTTGAKGRAGQIASVSYDHNTQTANLTLDSRKDYIDQLLERIGLYGRL
jgi:hypothetical protein